MFITSLITTLLSLIYNEPTSVIYHSETSVCVGPFLGSIICSTGLFVSPYVRPSVLITVTLYKYFISDKICLVTFFKTVLTVLDLLIKINYTIGLSNSIKKPILQFGLALHFIFRLLWRKLTVFQFMNMVHFLYSCLSQWPFSNVS